MVEARSSKLGDRRWKIGDGGSVQFLPGFGHWRFGPLDLFRAWDFEFRISPCLQYSRNPPPDLPETGSAEISLLSRLRALAEQTNHAHRHPQQQQ